MKKIFYLITLFAILALPVFAINSVNDNTDEFGLILARSKAGFIGKTNIYNPLGNITGIISVNIKGTSSVYDANGNILRIYKKTKDRITSYDRAGNVIGAYLLDENNNATQYDKDGNVVASYKYDYSNETVLCFTPTGFITGKFTTDINGKSRKYDQYGNITQLYYSEGLQSVNTNDGINGVFNSLWGKSLNSLLQK